MVPEKEPGGIPEEGDLPTMPERLKRWIEVPRPVYLGSKSRHKGGAEKFTLDELREQFAREVKGWGFINPEKIQLIQDDDDPSVYHAVAEGREK